MSYRLKRKGILIKPLSFSDERERERERERVHAFYKILVVIVAYIMVKTKL